MKIICYGASNTYGFDPRTYTGEPYEKPWPAILSEKLGIEVINMGWPGKKIPKSDIEIENAIKSIESISSKDDIVILMLGTNDLLSGSTPEESVLAMKNFIAHLKMEIILIGPPQISGMEKEVQKMNEGLKTLGMPYSDASGWNLELAFDGIHMSEKDQLIFADKIIEYFF